MLTTSNYTSYCATKSHEHTDYPTLSSGGTFGSDSTVNIKGSLTINSTSGNFDCNTMYEVTSSTHPANIGFASGHIDLWTRNHAIRFVNSTKESTNFRPAETDTVGLGASGYKWTHVYATTLYGTVGTSSDVRLKKDIYDIDKKYEDFFMNLKPKTFKYITEDSDNKTHFGFIAQEVDELAKHYNIDLALYHKNLKRDKDENIIYDENGNVDYDHYLEYLELMGLTVDMVQKLYSRVKYLENELL